MANKKVNHKGYKHIKRKLKQRFGIEYTKDTRKHILTGIYDKRYRLLRKQSLTRFVFLIDDVGETPFKVVWSSVRGSLVTAMYLNKEEKEEYEKEGKSSDIIEQSKSSKV